MKGSLGGFGVLGAHGNSSFWVRFLDELPWSGAGFKIDVSLVW